MKVPCQYCGQSNEPGLARCGHCGEGAPDAHPVARELLRSGLLETEEAEIESRGPLLRGRGGRHALGPAIALAGISVFVRVYAKQHDPSLDSLGHLGLGLALLLAITSMVRRHWFEVDLSKSPPSWRSSNDDHWSEVRFFFEKHGLPPRPDSILVRAGSKFGSFGLALVFAALAVGAWSMSRRSPPPHAPTPVVPASHESPTAALDVTLAHSPEAIRQARELLELAQSAANRRREDGDPEHVARGAFARSPTPLPVAVMRSPSPLPSIATHSPTPIAVALTPSPTPSATSGARHAAIKDLAKLLLPESGTRIVLEARDSAEEPLLELEVETSMSADGRLRIELPGGKSELIELQPSQIEWIEPKGRKAEQRSIDRNTRLQDGRRVTSLETQYAAPWGQLVGCATFASPPGARGSEESTVLCPGVGVSARTRTLRGSRTPVVLTRVKAQVLSGNRQEPGKLFETQGRIEEARAAYLKSCEAGLFASCADLAYLEQRQGQIPDARRHYARACQSYALACTRLGLMEQALGDLSAARPLLKSACERGDVRGCSELASLLLAVATESEIAQAEPILCKDSASLACSKARARKR